MKDTKLNTMTWISKSHQKRLKAHAAIQGLSTKELLEKILQEYFDKNKREI